MRIINKSRFILGIINIILALILILLTIEKHTMYRLILAAVCLFTGIMALIESIETKKQRQRREADLQEIRRLLGWDKKN
ncbi:MAG: hypothetical protein IKU19_01975 [Clostridia bacterium]|nr:hypothetical protein [Clostridia bacterium]